MSAQPSDPSLLTHPSQVSCPWLGLAKKCASVGPKPFAVYTEAPFGLTATELAPASGVVLPGMSAHCPPDPSSLTHPS
jgi:hypothetical protein